jgi:hypothetical protein
VLNLAESNAQIQISYAVDQLVEDALLLIELILVDQLQDRFIYLG